MENITIEVVKDKNIEQCRELCNELMAFQKSKAIISQESFDYMNFDTRMKKGYECALEKQVIIVKDNGIPVGYIFSTIDNIERDEGVYPEWINVEGIDNVIGFYPKWNNLPQKAGCLSNLYFQDKYRSMGLGSKLFEMSMEWFKRFSDVDFIFVYVSNGNDAALNFYLSRGFAFSHDVFGGFIKALYISKNGK